MKIILVTLKKILFWSYERGSWQYDVMCVLIRAFIFLAPNKFFQSRDESRPRLERRDVIGVQSTENPFLQKDSNATSISRIQKVDDSSGAKLSRLEKIR